jgi:DNA repair protein RecO (recombination protein O)
MKEFVSEAVVLSVSPSKEKDLVVTLFTKEYGRVRAKVTSGARMHSKFSPHLNPLNHVTVRLAEKRGFTLTDVLTNNSFREIRTDVRACSAALRTLAVVHALAPEGESDARVWHELLRSLESRTCNPVSFLTLFGHYANNMGCTYCGESPISHFAFVSHALLCTRCSMSVPENALVLIHA